MADDLATVGVAVALVDVAVVLGEAGTTDDAGTPQALIERTKVIAAMKRRVREFETMISPKEVAVESGYG